MNKRQMEAYDQEVDYICKVKDKLGLRSNAVALKLIIKRIKALMVNSKMEDELR